MLNDRRAMRVSAKTEDGRHTHCLDYQSSLDPQNSKRISRRRAEKPTNKLSNGFFLALEDFEHTLLVLKVAFLLLVFSLGQTFITINRVG